MTAASTPNALLPDPLAGITLLGELGRGSASIVHRARRGPVEFAVKVLRDRPDSDAARTTYQREAAVLANVRHPALIRIHAVGEIDGRPALVMDLVDGETLQDVLVRRGALDEPTAVRIALDAAGALAAAHATGLVHRDVKPANLIVQADGHAKLIDFGLVTRAGTRQSRDATVGTVRYSPPEQTGLLGRAIDGRSDLYSLGVVLFEMLTGRPPFEADDVGELVRLHAAVRAPALAEVTTTAEASPSLMAIVARLLAKDPDDRYQTAAGLTRDLERLAASEPGRADFAIATHDDPRAAAHDLPLIGRDDEASALREAWNRAHRGHGSVALIEGSAGLGKGRLLRELGRVATSQGALELTGRSVTGDPTPLAPLREAIDGHLTRLASLDGADRERARREVRDAVDAAGAVVAQLSPRLAALTGRSTSAAPELTGDQYTAAIARFFLELATRHGGAVLRLVDVARLDETTLQVLAQIAARLADTPLLVVGTSRDDATSVELREPFEQAVGDLLATRVALAPLSAPSTRTLLSALLGGVDLDPELVTQLHHRSGGNPFALQEYVRAITHAGLVRPSWGTLLVDRTGLEQLALPEDVMGLVLARVDRLGAPARTLLTAAAVAGNRFSVSVTAGAAELELEEAVEACTEALAERLIERRGPDRFAFTHERVREALVAPLDDGARAGLHLRLADAMEARGTGLEATPEETFAIAHHLAHAPREGTAARRLSWSIRGADAALAAHGARRATELFAAAQEAADELGRPLDLDVHERWAIALRQVGDVARADAHADRVLAESSDGIQRARVLLHRSQTLFSVYDAAGAQAAADAGLAALGRPLPTGRLRLLLSTIASALVGLVMLATRRGFGSVTEPAAREALGLEVDLLRAGGQVSYISMRPLGVAAFILRALPRAVRLGASRQLAQVMASTTVVIASLGAFRLRTRLVEGSVEIAKEIDDPSALAYAELYRFLSLEAAGRTREAGAAGEGLLADHGRWLETSDLLMAAGAVAYNLDLRGHTREALREWRSVHERVVRASASGTGENPYLLMGWITLETLGERTEAAQLRQAVHELGRLAGNNAYRHQSYLGALIRYFRDQGEYGAELLEAIRATDGLGIDPRTANPWVQAHVAQPFAVHVEFAERMHDEVARAAHLAEARRRWKIVRRARCAPLFEGYNLVAYANLLRLSGKPAKAERTLRRAETVAIACDNLRVHCEIARARCLLARERGEESEAGRQAQIALRLAADHGWRGLLDGLRRDVGPAPGVVIVPSHGGPRGDASNVGRSLGASRTSGGQGSSGSLRSRRTLDTLLALSLAASHTHDPQQLANISLDHVVALLGAERGFLFLTDDHGELQLSACRDAAGTDLLGAGVGWSATVIERVLQTRSPLLITGAEEALAIGAESAVQHGLRSILACPLLVEGRVLGVLKVDSRLARGIFGEGDSDILSAIGAHIAVALETTRAAQLERTVAAEREQRGLAEALRDAMADVATTLDPVEVLDRTLERAWRVIGYDRAAVLLRDAATGQWSVPTVSGDLALDDARAALATDADRPFLDHLASRTEPEVMSESIMGGTPAERVLGASGAWLSVPLVARGELAGIVLMATDEPGLLDEAKLGLAATFTGQGLIAHENARLFKAVERMATTDELTQVHNRRHFFELGDTQFLTAQRYDLPLATLMLDVDHFKRVNDTYGHAAGDDVIRGVAARLHALIRTVDIVGRYGGEEFAFVLPCTGDDATILAERLRSAVASEPVDTCEGPITVTVSIGVAVYDHDDAHLSATLGRADLALYEAKRLGRNRVELAHEGGERR